jgi:hypothetical protein
MLSNVGAGGGAAAPAAAVAAASGGEAAAPKAEEKKKEEEKEESDDDMGFGLFDCEFLSALLIASLQLISTLCFHRDYSYLTPSIWFLFLEQCHFNDQSQISSILPMNIPECGSVLAKTPRCGLSPKHSVPQFSVIHGGQVGLAEPFT